MKTYKVNVNGTEYAISIELMSEQEAAAAKSAPAAAPAQAPAAAGAGEEVKAPMQGTILSVKVKNGDAVSKGQVLFILEAMKMENEIMAANDGVITSVCVQEGAAVSNGTVLCTIQ
ncbi:MAG: biotin/lipoyl-binding protein [Clostridia bacterium]|nr:biotin/lipoyl-binding protein [Clostridia bacterium]